MKKKTISKVIENKVLAWVSSIDDEGLRNRLESGVVVTGGCIVSMLLNEDVNDYDIYLTDKKLVKDVAEYYCKLFNQSNLGRKTKVSSPLHAWVLDGSDVTDWKDGRKKLSEFAYDYPDKEFISGDDGSHVSGMITSTTDERIKIMVNSDGVAQSPEKSLSEGDDIPAQDEELGFKPVYLSTNAITLSDKIQIVIRFYGKPEEIHKNYDYAHTTNYWTIATGLVTNTGALEAILAKELIYKGSKYPITSVIRSRKFIGRGWTINAGQYLKMAMQISELDLQNIHVLEDQLVGVDSRYFMQFIKRMREKIDGGDKEKKVPQDYVISVIDRIFG